LPWLFGVSARLPLLGINRPVDNHSGESLAADDVFPPFALQVKDASRLRAITFLDDLACRKFLALDASDHALDVAEFHGWIG